MTTESIQSLLTNQPACYTVLVNMASLFPHRSTTYRRTIRAVGKEDPVNESDDSSFASTDNDEIPESINPYRSPSLSPNPCMIDADGMDASDERSDTHLLNISFSSLSSDDGNDEGINRFSSLSSDDEIDHEFFGNVNNDPADDLNAVPVDDDIYKTINRGNLSLAVKIMAIAVFFNLSNSVINAFLALFCYLKYDVPKDARTIKQTPRNGPQSDNFAHFSLAKGIQRKLRSDIVGRASKEILLQINMDGIPLFKNSRTQFWPILCRVVNGSDRNPFVVSVYCGLTKPPSVSEYVMPFLNEYEELKRNGIRIGDSHCTIRIQALICDAPARSLVKGIIGHNGKKGCERCNQTGQRVKNKTIFKQVNGGRLRDDNSFRSQSDKLHHKAKSPFLDTEIDMVRQFPLDYMHLICLGVMKRLLQIWTSDEDHGLNADEIAVINNRIAKYKECFPGEFNRKGRPLEDLCRWKATEFRCFLLYSGPLILKGILSNDKYEHFMVFHTCIRILCSPTSTMGDYHFAKEWLNYFVDHFGHIYGVHHLVYNVHSLSHIADDCIYFNAPLDNFSAFPFENYLGKMKKLLRGTRKPMAQLYKRLIEIENSEYHIHIRVESKYCDDSLKSLMKSFKPNSKADAFCLLEDGTAIKLVDMGDRFFRGYPLILSKTDDGSYADFSTKAVNSSKLGIFIVNGKETVSKQFPIESLVNASKCILMPYSNCYDEKSYLLVPILHHA